MGYGWPEDGEPVLSRCDVNALTFTFAWAPEGSDPTAQRRPLRLLAGLRLSCWSVGSRSDRGLLPEPGHNRTCPADGLDAQTKHGYSHCLMFVCLKAGGNPILRLVCEPGEARR
jgi:hypothetical protein